MKVQIMEVKTREQRENVFCFRYQVYVQEMHRRQKYADHGRERIEEPMDVHGHILVALEGTRVVGTVRYNLGCEGGFDGYEDLYRLREFGPFYPRNVSITTKLMVAPDFRRSTLPMKLALACYKAGGVNQASMFDLIDCNPPLVGYFNKLGYRPLLPILEHPEYGEVIRMVLVIRDVEHLQRVGSPFATHARHFDLNDPSVIFFRQNMLANISNLPQGLRNNTLPKETALRLYTG